MVDPAEAQEALDLFQATRHVFMLSLIIVKDFPRGWKLCPVGEGKFSEHVEGGASVRSHRVTLPLWIHIDRICVAFQVCSQSLCRQVQNCEEGGTSGVRDSEERAGSGVHANTVLVRGSVHREAAFHFQRPERGLASTLGKTPDLPFSTTRTFL